MLWLYRSARAKFLQLIGYTLLPLQLLPKFNSVSVSIRDKLVWCIQSWLKTADAGYFVKTACKYLGKQKEEEVWIHWAE